MSAFVGEDARCDLERVVQTLVGVYLVQRAKRSRFGVGGAIDAPSNAGLVHEPSAHNARLERNIYGAVGKPPSIEFARRFEHSDELCVPCRIFRTLASVARAGYDARLCDGSAGGETDRCGAGFAR